MELFRARSDSRLRPNVEQVLCPVCAGVRFQPNLHGPRKVVLFALCLGACVSYEARANYSRAQPNVVYYDVTIEPDIAAKITSDFTGAMERLRALVQSRSLRSGFTSEQIGP